MWLSLNIISKMVDISGISPEDLAYKLTMSTAEIDTIDYMNQNFNTIYTAKILEVKPHPNADKLTLVDLDTGKEKVRVVCGAPNHKKGDIVALATVGTKFSEDFIIKKTKIRGEESIGMLCSEKELGLSDDHSGIMIFPPNTAIGLPLSKIYSDWVDVRFEIDNKSITHRPDLWSHTGFAREIGALLGRSVKDVINRSLLKNFTNLEKLSVSIEKPEASPRYSGLIIKNIKIGESPSWLKAYVTSIGMRPINNIVDITNYVMAEIGEPMHAFDRKKLRGSEIIVRMAKKGETLMTLDSKVFTLDNEDIVIADKEGAVALAGVMGGGNSEIDGNTSEIVLEAANFNPVNIRKTAQKYTQRTEAAIRFEKALSPELTEAAIIRCYDLIKQVIPTAEACSEIIDAYPVKPGKKHIELTTDFIRKRLGEDVNDDKITSILTSLDFKVEKKGTNLKIEVPHYRATKDISIPMDIVEEVGRIYGYDNIKFKTPYVPCKTPEKNDLRLFERQIKNILSSDQNMIETSNYSFVGEDIITKLGIHEDKELRLSNPLSQEQDRLRRSLIPNIIKNIVLNQRFHEKFLIYELGRVYLKDNRKSTDLASEKRMITGVSFNKKTGTPIFYDVKNIVLGLMDKLKVKDYKLLPESKNIPTYAHPGRSMLLTIENKCAGIIFELHPKIKKEFEINGSVSMFDIDLDILYDCKKEDKQFIELQKFPSVPFEISILADRLTYTDDICSIIRNSIKEYISSIDVISIYEGKPIPEGKKSVSIKIIFAAKDKTLGPDEIDKMQKTVIDGLNKKGYQLR